MFDNPAFRHAMHNAYMADPYLRAVLRQEACARHLRQLNRMARDRRMWPIIPLAAVVHYHSIVEYFDEGGWMG